MVIDARKGKRRATEATKYEVGLSGVEQLISPVESLNSGPGVRAIRDIQRAEFNSCLAASA